MLDAILVLLILPASFFIGYVVGVIIFADFDEQEADEKWDGRP